MGTTIGAGIPEPRFEDETAAAVVESSAVTLDNFGPEYEEKALVLRQSVAIQKIENQEQFTVVSAAGLNAASNINSIEEILVPLKQQRYAAYTRVLDLIKKKTSPFVEIKEKSGRLIGQYQYEMEQQRKREEEAARKLQQDEDERIRAAQAEQLAKEGRIEDGVALLEQPVMPSAPVVVATSAPKTAGVTSSGDGVFSAEVTNLMELIKAVAEGKVPILALEPDMSFLNKQAKAMKGLLNYPGVKVNRTFKAGFRPKK